jgi:cytoskeletal protein CcmA (bactofilin family)
LKNVIKIIESSHFKGVYSSSNDIDLYGHFDGSLQINTLHVKSTGIFTGRLSAQTIIVEGQVFADIETENLNLKATGVIDGDVIYRKLVIEEGGMIKSSNFHNISKPNLIYKKLKSTS